MQLHGLAPVMPLFGSCNLLFPKLPLFDMNVCLFRQINHHVFLYSCIPVQMCGLYLDLYIYLLLMYTRIYIISILYTYSMYV